MTGKIKTDMELEQLEKLIQNDLPEMRKQFQRGRAAAAEPTLSGALRRAVAALRQPYEKTGKESGIPVDQLCAFMGGGTLPSDAMDRFANVAHLEVMTR